jgi:hypothetical protein
MKSSRSHQSQIGCPRGARDEMLAFGAQVIAAHQVGRRAGLVREDEAIGIPVALPHAPVQAV